MKGRQFVGILLMFVLMFLSACAPVAAPAPQAPAAPVPTPKTVAAPAPEATPVAKTAWQTEWDQTIAAAKKEGRLTMAVTIGSLTRSALSDAFRSQFGLPTEWLSGASGELTARLLAERRAGIHSADAAIMGFSAPYLSLKPVGALRKMDEMLFLPDLTQPKEIENAWRFGLEWVDKDHTVLNFAAALNVAVVVNTKLVQTGEVKAYRDLLSPKWKEKIVMLDPTLSAGPGVTAVRALGDYIMNWDYVRQLADQKPLLVTDARLQMTWLAQGKYPIVLGTRPESVKEFLDLGAPVKILLMDEGEATTVGASAVAAMKDAPHPNAAKLFVNWLLSKDGQTVYSRSYNQPSNRTDVSAEGVYPEMVPQPGRKYVSAGTEEWILGMADAAKKTKDIFGKLKQ